MVKVPAKVVRRAHARERDGVRLIHFGGRYASFSHRGGRDDRTKACRAIAPRWPPRKQTDRKDDARRYRASRPSAGGSAIAIEVRNDDISTPGVSESLVEKRPELIFHLSAVVSGEAEVDFEKGYRVNLDGTRLLLEAVRKIGGGYRPRFVFASSFAIFGAPFPKTVPSHFL